jgi:thiol-disulfide isomerase/thioredoxin
MRSTALTPVPQSWNLPSVPLYTRIYEIPPAYAKDANALRSAAPSLVFVGVTWCKYCKEAKPTMEKVASMLSSNVPVYWVDADKKKELVKSLGVMSFPTIMYVDSDGITLFNEERTADKIVGFVCANAVNNRYEFCTSPLNHE